MPRLVRPRPRVAVSAAAVAALSCAACGGGSSSPANNTTPSVSAGGGAPVIPVKLTDAGCDPQSFSLKPGTIIFSVTNSGSTTVEEMEIDDQQGHVKGDVEGVQPGQTRSFVVDLGAGTYQVHCPQGSTTFGTLTVG